MTARGVEIAIMRHGITAWNEAGLIQGRSDIGLSALGRQQVAAWRLPQELANWRWQVSPLRRARQTAELLGQGEALVEAALIEADWGSWEGMRLADLRTRFGEEMVQNEARGLDFRPPGGESPRDVQKRLQPLLERWLEEGANVAAVSHKGTLRALYALATGWSMTGKPPHRLHENALHRFRLGAEGVTILRLNQPLAEAEA